MKDKDIINRMLTNRKNECFITLKDLKPNFKNNPKVRLTKPAKNEIGRISKNIFDKIKYKLRDSLRTNMQKDTSAVIESFLNSIQDGEDVKKTLPPSPTSFSPVTSTNVGISPQKLSIF